MKIQDLQVGDLIQGDRRIPVQARWQPDLIIGIKLGDDGREYFILKSLNDGQTWTKSVHYVMRCFHKI